MSDLRERVVTFINDVKWKHVHNHVGWTHHEGDETPSEFLQLLLSDILALLDQPGEPATLIIHEGSESDE